MGWVDETDGSCSNCSHIECVFFWYHWYPARTHLYARPATACVNLVMSLLISPPSLSHRFARQGERGQRYPVDQQAFAQAAAVEFGGTSARAAADLAPLLAMVGGERSAAITGKLCHDEENQWARRRWRWQGSEPGDSSGDEGCRRGEGRWQQQEQAARQGCCEGRGRMLQ